MVYYSSGYTNLLIEFISVRIYIRIYKLSGQSSMVT